MKKLTFHQVIRLHELLIAETGGTAGLRDQGLLESALNTPFQSFGGEDFYPSMLEKALRIGYSLIKNHAFLDGNKRIGLLAMLTFLKINNYNFVCPDDRIIRMVLGVASGKIEDQEFLEWLYQSVTNI